MDGRNELRITQNPDRGVVTARPGFFVVAACNPNAPGARMSEAMLSRFTMQFEVTTDYALAKRLGVESGMVTAAQNMRTKMDKGVTSWSPQFRELMAFMRISVVFGQEFAIRNLVMNAPEMDRSVCADVISNVFHNKYKGLKTL
jgi:nitric oxide reductase NorQ protein